MFSAKMRLFGTWALLAFWPSPAHATSIVALVQANRILLAADSRKSGENPGENTCKITVMNDGAFAIDGLPRLTALRDNSIVWDAPALGREAYANHYGNILDAANEWADRGVKFWTSFLSTEMAYGENFRTHVSDVVDYDVAGFAHNPDKPSVVIASVQIDPTAGPPYNPHKLIVVLPPRNEPYSSNSTTRELIEGQTERAKATLAAWLPKLATIKESDRNWHALEYLIQQTAKYDTSVNGTVNVLEITAGQKPHWLQNLTCK